MALLYVNLNLKAGRDTPSWEKARIDDKYDSKTTS